MVKLTTDQAFTLFGLDSSATREELDEVFKIKSRMTHPDRFAGSPESEIKMATKEFQRLNAAYALLTQFLDSGQKSNAKPASDGKSKEGDSSEGANGA
ncbi:MAG: J domain-containing protein [Microbacteriaceae bacterium]|nr:J domain-containing protein [Microbacteriaceae bacterium]